MNNNAKNRFEVLCTAALDHQLCLARCTRISTGKPVYVICAIEQENGVVTYAPLAEVFTRNPLNEITPPGYEAPILI